MHSFWRFIIHLLSQFLKYQVLGFPLGLRSSDDSDPVEKKNFWGMLPLAPLHGQGYAPFWLPQGYSLNCYSLIIFSKGWLETRHNNRPPLRLCRQHRRLCRLGEEGTSAVDAKNTASTCRGPSLGGELWVLCSWMKVNFWEKLKNCLLPGEGAGCR